GSPSCADENQSAVFRTGRDGATGLPSRAPPANVRRSMRTTNRETRARLEWTHAAVVGAGPARLAASGALARARVRRVVVGRERLGSAWRDQRWDSFRLNGPNWFNRVPGDCLHGPSSEFASAPEFVAALERLAASLPVRENVEVLHAERAGPVWRL